MTYDVDGGGTEPEPEPGIHLIFNHPQHTPLTYHHKIVDHSRRCRLPLHQLADNLPDIHLFCVTWCVAVRLHAVFIPFGTIR